MSYKKSHTSIFRKKHIKEIASLVGLLILAATFKFSVDFMDRRQEFPEKTRATLAINFDNENRVFEGEIIEEITILDALNYALAVGKIRFSYKLDENNQTWIMEINDHINNVGNKSFSFYLNDRKINSQDLNKTVIKAGDYVVVKFEQNS